MGRSLRLLLLRFLHPLTATASAVRRRISEVGTDMADDQRFDRMEKNLDKLGDKIDELTKVVTAMARIEERMVTLFKRIDKHDERHDELHERLSEVEKTSTKRGAVYQLADKGFWLVIGAGLTYIVKTAGAMP